MSLLPTFGLKVCKAWYFVEECHAFVCVDVGAVVAHAVAYDEVWYSEGGVVAGNLVKGGLADADVWGFKLEYDEWLGFVVVDDGVAATLHAAEPERHFVGEACPGIAEVLDQPVCELLPHPFFGRECYPL